MIRNMGGRSNPAVVVIGRNEGNRLKCCLASVLHQTANVVYVDSGSSDGSPELARSLGASVVELNPALPYTAARARNEGVEFLLREQPGLTTVQFLDGDCALAEGWLACAAAELEQRPEVAAVCGRRRERFVNRSVFNRLCDLEWEMLTAQPGTFGGDVMVRIAAFRQVGGFNAALIAGEEPELSLRMRQKGWTILRISREMSVHDAAMTSFGQWCLRTVRSGHAYAEGAWLHGLEPERHWLRQSLSGWFWGLVLPLSVLSLAWRIPAAAFLLAGAYPVLALRIYRRMRRRGLTSSNASLYAVFCVLAKFPEVAGQIMFHVCRYERRRRRLIEYKTT